MGSRFSVASIFAWSYNVTFDLAKFFSQDDTVLTLIRT